MEPQKSYITDPKMQSQGVAEPGFESTVYLWDLNCKLLCYINNGSGITQAQELNKTFKLVKVLDWWGKVGLHLLLFPSKSQDSVRAGHALRGQQSEE